MNHFLRRSFSIWSAGSVLLAILASCGSPAAPGTDSSPRDSAFYQLKDSIYRCSPYAGRLADSLMQVATDSQSYYSYLALKGQWYLNNSKCDSAVTYARRTQVFARHQQPSPRNHLLLAKGYALEAATYHQIRQRPQLALRLYQEAFSHIMLSDPKDLAPDMAANLADAYVFLNDLPNAARWYRKALFLVDSLNLPATHNITLYMGLGQIYTTLEDFKSAQMYYEKTDRQFGKMEPKMQAYFLNNYGNLFYYKKDYHRALSIFLRLKNHLQRYFHEDDFNLYICKINLADTYLNLGQIDLAEKYVDETSDFFVRQHVNDGIYYANTIKMGIALKRRQYEQIRRLIEDEPRMKDIDQNMVNIRSRYLTDYYVHTGNYKKAYETMVVHEQHTDSSEHNKQNMRASEIMQRFTEDTIKLHYELELREKDAVVSRSRATLWGMACLALALVSILITSILYLRKRKLQADLDIFVLRLATIRQRISPHFVFNVINAKIGNTPKDESDVLVSMSKLIRQNLELSGHTYVNLSEELSFVNRYVELQRTLIGDSLEFTIHQPSQQTTCQTVIPSMFIQILVENAIKHGLKAIEGAKRLQIDVTDTPTYTTITVTDNGPGFDIRRSHPDSTKTGLYVIRHTMAVMNKNNKPGKRMRLMIHNIEDPDGSIRGCQSILLIPKGMKKI